MKTTLKVTLSITILLFFVQKSRLYGQVAAYDTLSFSKKMQEQKDVMDYYRAIFKRKSNPDNGTISKKSLGPFFTPTAYVGYNLVTGALVGVSSSISFYTHVGDDAKISSIQTENDYTQNKQSLNFIHSNLWLNHEKLNLLGDWRYFQFPTSTYGLGSKTTTDNVDAVSFSHIRFYEVVMKEIYKHVLVGLGYNLDYHWNITETNTQDLIPTDFDRYGFKTTSTSSGMVLSLQYDSRLNSNNASRGTYANLQIRDNSTFLGSGNNWQSATFDFRHYFPISKKSGNRLAIWTYDVLTLGGTTPYFDLPHIGGDTYNNSGRGYAEGRFRGTNMIYTEAEYRYRIMKNGLLGGVFFASAASFTEPTSNKFEKVNTSLGLGLRIKVAKSSNTNLCLDYGFGMGNTSGFSFNLNEVF